MGAAGEPFFGAVRAPVGALLGGAVGVREPPRIGDCACAVVVGPAHSPNGNDFARHVSLVN